MSSRMYSLLVKVYFLMQKLEHGDADSSSSTLRVFGVVAIVLAVLLTIGIALMAVFPTLGQEIGHGRTVIEGWFAAVP